MEASPTFVARSFVQAQLLVAPVYHEDISLWETLRAERDHISHYFRQIGQELVIDEAEGYAFLRQIEPDGEERVPRIGRRQVLGYTATLLLVCLREELARFDASPTEPARSTLADRKLESKVDLHWFIDREHPLGIYLVWIGKRSDKWFDGRVEG